jgi:ankyrin repeat protein
MRASYSGYLDLVKFLLESGADKEITDTEGNKAIHYVREHSFADLKPLLK